MELNNIQLNSLLIAEMYKNSLVEIEEIHDKQLKVLSSPSGKTGNKTPAVSPAPVNEQDQKNWKYLGENKKNILLIVRYENENYLPDAQLNFLTSVLSACKLNLADVAILNIAHTPSAVYKEVQGSFKARVTILFGLSPAEFAMPVDFPQFQIQALNGCTFLHNPDLESLDADKVLKSKFWVCLRRVFEV